MNARRTKRRFAHELFPHAKEGEVRPLDVEVPYRIARAVGYDVAGTGWFDAETREQGIRMAARTVQLMNEARITMLAMALHKGLSGDEAWRWADSGMGDGEMWRVYEEAAAYGVDVHAIKPYPCGPEPDYHDHLGEPSPRSGSRLVTRVPGRESECVECTEPVPVENENVEGAR